ncbi:MAG: hypothetical protein IGR80_17490 [Synechococcales cyanobacterium K44_A2020_017]|uniref:hypothetical protein n=1 Tax=Leptolyngbya sp. CCY15150 TaxID=2767772 RepID=UPI0019519755|nr:hypothetical protein [Leptolyngbya sp. CCY15150]MBF2087349.1 hypothetical protein [Synechococcales cyanobacterium K32_A2020_035]MBF2096532.1 hypothetical protein [Synechococcales cyanobacterium K44_A2020_017]
MNLVKLSSDVTPVHNMDVESLLVVALIVSIPVCCLTVYNRVMQGGALIPRQFD